MIPNIEKSPDLTFKVLGKEEKKYRILITWPLRACWEFYFPSTRTSPANLNDIPGKMVERWRREGLHFPYVIFTEKPLRVDEARRDEGSHACVCVCVGKHFLNFTPRLNGWILLEKKAERSLTSSDDHFSGEPSQRKGRIAHSFRILVIPLWGSSHQTLLLEPFRWHSTG